MNDDKKFKDEIMKLADGGHGEAIAQLSNAAIRRYMEEENKRSIAVTLVMCGISLAVLPWVLRASHHVFPNKFYIEDLDF